MLKVITIYRTCAKYIDLTTLYQVLHTIPERRSTTIKIDSNDTRKKSPLQTLKRFVLNGA